MSRKRKRGPYVPRCRQCGDMRLETDLFWRGFCDNCRHLQAVERRKQTATRALSKAKQRGTVERDGQTFTVTVLPPKRK